MFYACIYMYMYIYNVYVCMYVCMHGCMYVCMFTIKYFIHTTKKTLNSHPFGECHISPSHRSGCSGCLHHISLKDLWGPRGGNLRSHK